MQSPSAWSPRRYPYHGPCVSYPVSRLRLNLVGPAVEGAKCIWPLVPQYPALRPRRRGGSVRGGDCRPARQSALRPQPNASRSGYQHDRVDQRRNWHRQGSHRTRAPRTQPAQKSKSGEGQRRGRARRFLESELFGHERRTVMNGRGNELIDLAKTNLFH